MTTATLPLRTASGRPPVYTLRTPPGALPLRVTRIDAGFVPVPASPATDHAHAHDFLVVAYVERPGGWLAIGDRRWTAAAGDVFVIGPGDVVRLGVTSGLRGWAVFFPPELLGVRDAGAFLGWHTHPLLHPFVRGTGRAQHLTVPPRSRDSWTARLGALDTELRERREGYRESATALVTLLLVDLGRFAAAVPAVTGPDADPLLASVFRTIEDRYARQLSLADVARAVSLTPEHLTTVVRRRTGRTVGAWITERRMAEARDLLLRTDLPVSHVAHRCGYPDAAYFARVFRRSHGVTPRAWRRSAAAPG